MGNQLTQAHTEPTQIIYDPFTNVAQDIKLRILFELDVKDIISLSQVSKTWYCISSEAEIWEKLHAKNFGRIEPEIVRLKGITWKQQYRNSYNHFHKKAQSKSLAGRFFSMLRGKQPGRAIIVGFPEAGKSTILYKLKMADQISNVPTIGFQVETVTYKQVSFCMFELGQDAKIRPLLRHYIVNTNIIILVVDSTDKASLPGVKSELITLISDPGLEPNTPVLCYLNKSDLPNALSVAEVVDILSLYEVFHGRQWYVQQCCALNGDGLFEGIDWIKSVL